ncbi:hypothetical protein F5884DRAFT_794450 [Xylogone sp. PMI_703]|nr:hypothetical protein F5884DRAFT_794450 [Xylogone sp. PMI_703]
MPDGQLAPSVCSACKLRKRKCDRRLPECTLCSTKRRICRYTAASSVSRPADILDCYYPNEQDNGSHPRSESGYCYASGAAAPGGKVPMPRDVFPVAFFLDQNVFQHHQLEIPRTGLPLPHFVDKQLGSLNEQQRISSRFFKTVHNWLPFISKRRFEDDLLVPPFSPRPDVALLILGMKLVTSQLDKECTGPSSLYYAAKMFFVELETAGFFSLQMLQARLLIALHEIAHTIYPSAYASVGECVRYGHALGINPRSTIKSKPPVTWVDMEERKRVWWTILVLDRYVNIGCRGRLVSVENAQPYDILPAGDQSWDRGEYSPTDLSTFASPSSVQYGRFALLVQSCSLLGQVLHHVCEDSTDPGFQQKALQLNNTIHSLLDFSSGECDPHEPVPTCEQRAICFSALFVLYESSVTAPSRDLNQTAIDAIAKTVVDTIIKEVANMCQYILEGMMDDANASPLILDAIYQATVAYIKLHKGNYRSKEFEEGLNLFKRTLRLLRQRWRAAGSYMIVLEAQEIALLAENL